MSFRFFRARTLTVMLAGLGLNMTFSPVRGSVPSRAGCAGTFLRMILHRPGSWYRPLPFLPRALEISAVRASRTALTSLRDRLVAAARLFRISDLLGAFALPPFGAAAAFAIISHPSL